MRLPHTLLLALLVALPVHAGWQDWLKKVIPDETTGSDGAASAVSGALTEEEMVAGLREALDKGVNYAIGQLGRDNGFLADPQVRIPMPEQLDWAEKALRTLRQDALADQFVASMNHAAERAVPEAIDIFRDLLSQMTIADAHAILQGPADAATSYFREHAESQLRERLRPLVSRATAEVGVTRYYKQMTDRAKFLSAFVDEETLDLDGYVTQRALDGLFLKIAEEERKIRENPLERSTDLLKRVFSQYRKR